MDEVVIRTSLDKVAIREVRLLKRSNSGVIYGMSRDWVGKKVKVVLDEEPEKE
jgi:hypothetical protein